jgi:hypothetical protein
MRARCKKRGEHGALERGVSDAGWVVGWGCGEKALEKG